MPTLNLRENYPLADQLCYMPSSYKGVCMSKANSDFDEKLEKAYFIMAEIIRDHGEKYLPIFKRLHEEREKRKANMDLISIAIKAADQK